MKIVALSILVSLLLVIPAIASETTEDTGAILPADISESGNAGPIWDGPKDVLWDNGPLVTSVGTGVGGADESIVDASEVVNGFGCQWGADIRLADDFTVPAGETWEISTITVFGYQTGSGPPSTILECYIEIFNGHPETGTSVYGDLFTDVMTSSSWMNCYRVKPPTSGTSTERPIMANVCEFASPIVLSEGTYFLVWQLDGTGSSGPWTPPVTINGQLNTGDAIQYFESMWNPIDDSASLEPKGLPFILENNSGALDNETWATIKTIF